MLTPKMSLLTNQLRDPIPLCNLHAAELERLIQDILEFSNASDALLNVFWMLRTIHLQSHPAVTPQQCHRCLNAGNYVNNNPRGAVQQLRHHPISFL